MLTQRQLFIECIAQTSEAPLALEIERAEGIYMYDIYGKRYIDLISGVSVSNVGHCHPKVIEAVKQQLDKYMHLMVYGEYIQSPQVKYAQLLTEQLPESLNSVYFVNSGSEAIEGALKLAKRYTGRMEVIACKNAYHGSTHGALSVMGGEEFKNSFRPLVPGVSFIEFNRTEDLCQITRNTACVLIEPVQGEGGIIPADADYLKLLRKKCDETGCLLIFDEIQTGMGRTGTLFAFEQYETVPDILVLAKAMGGGMPLGAFISSRVVMQCLTHDPVLGHITTFGGHPVCCAAGMAALQVLMEEDLVSQVAGKEKLFRELLSSHPLIQQIRSKGLMMAVELKDADKVSQVMKKCVEKGVILDIFLFRANSFRIAPPLTITESQIREASGIILEAMDEVV